MPASGLIVYAQITDNNSVVGSMTFPNQTFSSGVARTYMWANAVPSTMAAGSYKISLGVFTSDWSTALHWVDSAGSLAVTAAASAPTPAPGTAPNGAQLLLNEEFNSFDLASPSNPRGFWRPNEDWQDLANGGYKDFAGGHFNINPNHATFAPYSPFSVSNGILTLRTFRTPSVLVEPIRQQMVAQGQGSVVPNWCGANVVQNRDVKKWKYGYFEFKARWPRTGKGMGGALWFYATDGSADPLYKGAAEIDLLEIFGLPDAWVTTIHLKNTVGEGYSVDVGKRHEDTGSWHTYALDWQPTYLRFYRDGVQVYEITGADAAFFNTTMGIRFGFGMDAPWFFDYGFGSDANTPDNLLMELDYIRVYNYKP